MMFEIEFIELLKAIKFAVYFMPLGGILLLTCLVIMMDRIMKLMIEIILKLEQLRLQ